MFNKLTYKLFRINFKQTKSIKKFFCNLNENISKPKYYADVNLNKPKEYFNYEEMPLFTGYIILLN
jgi:hypothetical protein